VNFLVALGGLGLLLLVGLALRIRSRILRRLFLPVPVIGGFVGLVLGPYMLDWVPAETVAIWASLPAVLINFVFAALFLGVTIPPATTLVRLSGPLFRFGTVTALGQYVVALAITAAVLAPLFGTPELFACILEVGFAGGHGTAAAMDPVFADLGFAAGGALGQMSATVGIVVAVVGGMALIQHGVRRGQLTQLSMETADDAGPSPGPASLGLVPPERRASVATGTVTASVLDSFTFHVAITSLAVLIGWVILGGVRAIHPTLAGFPLFPLAMIGGMVVQLSAERIGAASYFDRATFERILGLSLEVLVVAAIASLRLDLFLQNLVPFSILMVAGILWVAFAFLVLAPRMIPSYWFEQAITDFGMLTGVTAVGPMLLRVVDPQTRTPAAQAFAAKQMVFSPLLGGGLVTATIPLFLQGFGLWPVLAVVAGLALLTYFWPGGRKERGSGAPSDP
jgi:ESS family glutamate:Na+ symporter